MSSLKGKVDQLENRLKPGRKIYQILFVCSDEEADRIEEERRLNDPDYRPARPGEIRFIMADDWLPEWGQGLKDITGDPDIDLSVLLNG